VNPELPRLREGLPAELWDLDRFLLYQIKLRPNGSLGKVPQRLAGARLLNTSPLAPEAWLSLRDALDLLEQGHGNGLGLALLSVARHGEQVVQGSVSDRMVHPQFDGLVEEAALLCLSWRVPVLPSILRESM
jgi:hypothetical protein